MVSTYHESSSQQRIKRRADGTDSYAREHVSSIQLPSESGLQQVLSSKVKTSMRVGIEARGELKIESVGGWMKCDVL